MSNSLDFDYELFKKNALIRLLSLDEYVYLRDNLYKVDVSSDEEYQRRFNAFYKVRRNATWRKKFYKYFEKAKNNPNIEFDTILLELFLATNNIEASFASKMLATIKPNMPIWDRFVVKNLNINVSEKNKDDKYISTIEIYRKIVQTEYKLLNNIDVKESITKFKSEFSEYDLTDIKILDYFLWNNRAKDE